MKPMASDGVISKCKCCDTADDNDATTEDDGDGDGDNDTASVAASSDNDDEDEEDASLRALTRSPARSTAACFNRRFRAPDVNIKSV
jgi:hypothetical protein